MKPPMLTVEQVAERLSKGAGYARRLMSSGRIRAAKIGNSWRADAADVEAFIDAQRPAPMVPVVDRDLCDLPDVPNPRFQ